MKNGVKTTVIFGWRGQKAKKKVVSRHYARIVERIGIACILW